MPKKLIKKKFIYKNLYLYLLKCTCQFIFCIDPSFSNIRLVKQHHLRNSSIVWHKIPVHFDSLVFNNFELLQKLNVFLSHFLFESLLELRLHCIYVWIWFAYKLLLNERWNISAPFFVHHSRCSSNSFKFLCVYFPNLLI